MKTYTLLLLARRIGQLGEESSWSAISEAELLKTAEQFIAGVDGRPDPQPALEPAPTSLIVSRLIDLAIKEQAQISAEDLLQLCRR